MGNDERLCGHAKGRGKELIHHVRDADADKKSWVETQRMMEPEGKTDGLRLADGCQGGDYAEGPGKSSTGHWGIGNNVPVPPQEPRKR
jgi:hypothetical protein